MQEISFIISVTNLKALVYIIKTLCSKSCITIYIWWRFSLLFLSIIYYTAGDLFDPIDLFDLTDVFDQNELFDLSDLFVSISLIDLTDLFDPIDLTDVFYLCNLFASH